MNEFYLHGVVLIADRCTFTIELHFSVFIVIKTLYFLACFVLFSLVTTSSQSHSIMHT